MSTTKRRAASNPFRILGLTSEATEEQIRARYLHLVKKYPPERHPERFNEIHAAYEMAQDPLVLARQLLMPPDETPPSWEEVIEEQRAYPPRLGVDVLLSLGNRVADELPPANTPNQEP